MDARAEVEDSANVVKALVVTGFGDGENLSLEERAVPEVGPDDIRVRVTACGANASDWEFISGNPLYGRISRWAWKIDVCGSDVAGVVEAIGERVTGFEAGDRVVADTFETFGGFAEYCVAKADRWVKIPASISDVEAAALPQSGAIALDFVSDVEPGHAVLINGGGGGSGPYAIQLAKAKGAEVWAVDNAAKQHAMRSAGADHVLDFATEDFTALPQRFDRVLDLWGTRAPGVVARSLTPRGRYRLVGGPMGILLRVVMRGLVSRGRLGLLMVNQGPRAVAAMLDAVVAHAVRPNVGETAALSEAPAALARMGRREIAGKLVITF